MLEAERGAAKPENVSIVDLVANPTRGHLSGPLTRPDGRELECPILRGCDGQLVSLPCCWISPEYKVRSLAREPANGETRVVANFGVELDDGLGGGFAIGVQDDAMNAVDFGGLQPDFIAVELHTRANRDGLRLGPVESRRIVCRDHFRADFILHR